MSNSAQAQVEYGQVSLLDALNEQFGSVPWWMISALIHGGVLMLMMLLMVTVVEEEPPQIVTDIVMVPPTDEPITSTKIEPTPMIEEMTPVEAPVNFTEYPEVAEEIQTDDAVDSADAQGEPDAIANVQLGNPGFVSVMGPGGPRAGAFGRPGPGGLLRVGLPRGCSGPAVDAVKLALQWLARHQTEAGNWEIGRWGGSKSEDASVGVTGLGLLAFLGAGHTDRIGPHTETVIKATNWLMSRQADDGSIGQHGAGSNGAGYNHPIAGLALAEAYGMTGNKGVGLAAQRALDYSINVHMNADGGWRYSPGQAGDLSVTGWFAMQMKSARIAKLRVDPRGVNGLERFLETVTSGPGDPDAPYPGMGSYTAGSSRSAPMTSVAMLCSQILGAERDSPAIVGGARHLLEHLPSFDAGGKLDYYYWYYGTMVMFHIDGEQWKTWNSVMRDMLVERQRIAPADLELHGSWDCHGFSAEYGGRAFSTAMACLTLEVYYRYLPNMGMDVDEFIAWEAA